MADKTLNYYDQDTQTWKSPYATSTDLANVIQNVSNVSTLANNIENKLNLHFNEKVTQILDFNREASLTGQQTLTGFLDVPKSITIYTNRAFSRISSIGHFDGTKQITWSTDSEGNGSAYDDRIIEFIEDDNVLNTAQAVINADKTVTLNWEKTGFPSGNINLFVVAYYHGGEQIE